MEPAVHNPEELPLVEVLTTGGTIASTPRNGQLVAQESADQLVAGLDISGVGVRAREITRVGSYSMNEAELRLVAAAAVDAAAREVAGVVVTHGTDVMEETAFLTDLVHAAAAPVVFCGAQRAASAPDADGPRNLRDAIVLAADPASRGLGAVICMAGRAWPARFAAKTHSLALDAFSAPSAGPVADLSDGDVRPLGRPPRPPRFARECLDDPLPYVAIVPCWAGAGGELMRAAAAAGARGVVVDGFGSGNVPPAIADAAVELRGADVAVLVVSRCGAGPTSPRYGGPGGGATLARAGLDFGGSLKAPQARILLALALAAAGSAEGAAKLVAGHA